MSSGLLPRARRKLWRTRLGWHRSLRHIVDPVDPAPLLEQRPAPEDVIPFGEYLLLEDHAYVLHRDGTQSFRIHTLSHAWSSQALAQWDQIQRWFHTRQSRSTIRKAVLHQPDGTSRKQKVQHRTDQAGNHFVNLIYQPLQPGVTVEFEEQTDYFEFGAVGPAMWGQYLLQTGPPCRHRRLIVAVAQPFELTTRSHHGAPEPVIRQHGDYRIYQWDLYNTPGIGQEVLPNGRDFLPWIDFSTVPTWEPIYRHLKEELLPRPVVKSKHPVEPVTALLNRITKNEQSTREKLIAIHQHVASEIRYGRPPADSSNRRVRDPGDILGELRGDCKDKSALMLQMLERISVPAKIAVLLTSEEGRTSFLPSLRFNHAIVKAELEGRDVWIDPAAGPFSLGDVPRNVQGVQTMLMGRDGSEMIVSPQPCASGHTIRRDYRGRLTPEGHYEAEVAVVWTGQPAAELRSRMFDATDDDRQRMMQREIAGINPGASVGTIEFPTLMDLGQPLRMSYHVRMEHWARPVRRVWLARMPWDWTLHVTGVLAASERKFPLPAPDALDLCERHEIELPGGFRGYGLPYTRECRTPWLRYRCRIGIRDGRLIAVRRLQFNEGLLPPDRYGDFRTAWAQGADADGRDVLLISRR